MLRLIAENAERSTSNAQRRIQKEAGIPKQKRVERLLRLDALSSASLAKTFAAVPGEPERLGPAVALREGLLAKAAQQKNFSERTRLHMSSLNGNLFKIDN